ncbi:MAG: Ig-like domain-containing protein [Planctomycetaceae bacterium]
MLLAAPVAYPDAFQYGGMPYQTLNVSAANGVLANDTDSDGDSMSAHLVNSPSTGVISLNSDGSFEFTSYMGGADSFTYRVYDGQTYSAPTTATIGTAGGGRGRLVLFRV